MVKTIEQYKLTELGQSHNSTYPKSGVSCSKDSFAVNQSFVFQINPIVIAHGNSAVLRVAAKRLCFMLNNSKTFNTKLNSK